MRTTIFVILAAIAASCVGAASPRLYILDCGTISKMDTNLFGLKPEEVKVNQGFASPCYFVVHSKGTLLWDLGQVPDKDIPDDGTEVVLQDILKATTRLSSQLSKLGYKTTDITYIAMSHYHADHTANANTFAGSTWIVQ